MDVDHIAVDAVDVDKLLFDNELSFFFFFIMSFVIFLMQRKKKVTAS